LAVLAVADADAPAPPEAAEYRHLSFGPQIDFGIGTQMTGDDLVGDLGAQWFALQSRERRWLLGWDAMAGVRAGWLANQHPYFFWAGGGARGSAELAYRFAPERTWSLFAGGGASTLVQLMWHPGVPLTKLDTINAADGFGGLTANAGVRVSGGASYLTATRSFQAGLVMQEWLRGGGVVTPFSAFTQVGVSARVDFAGSFSARGEALYGWAPPRSLAGVDAVDAISRYDLAAQARYTFGNRMWLGLNLSFSQERDTLTYTAAKTHYDTANAPTFAVALAYGFPLGGEP